MKPRIIIAKILLLSLFAQTANAAESLSAIYADLKQQADTLARYINTLKTGEGAQYTTAIHVCIDAEGPGSKGMFTEKSVMAAMKSKKLEPLVVSLKNSEDDLKKYSAILANVNQSTQDVEKASSLIDTSGANSCTGAFIKLNAQLDTYKTTADMQAKNIDNNILKILDADLKKPSNIKNQAALEDALKDYPKCDKYRKIVIQAKNDSARFRDTIRKYSDELKARSLTMAQFKQQNAAVDCTGGSQAQAASGNPDISGTNGKKAEKPASAKATQDATKPKAAETATAKKDTNSDDLQGIDSGDLTGKPDPKTTSAEAPKTGTQINPDKVEEEAKNSKPVESLDDPEMKKLKAQVRAESESEAAATSSEATSKENGWGVAQPIVDQAQTEKPAPPPPPQPVPQPKAEQKVATEAAPPAPQAQQQQVAAGNPPPASQTNQQQTPDTPAPQQQSSSGWGTALAVGGGVLVLGALGAGGYYLYQQSQDNDDKNKDKKSSSNVALASTNPDNSSSASVGANQEVLAAVNEEAQKAQSGLMAAKSKQEYQDIAAGFANSAAGKLAAIGIVTQIETYTSSTGFSRAGLRLINTSNAEGEATAKSLFSAGVYDPLAGVEPAI